MTPVQSGGGSGPSSDAENLRNAVLDAVPLLPGDIDGALERLRQGGLEPSIPFEARQAFRSYDEGDYSGAISRASSLLQRLVDRGEDEYVSFWNPHDTRLELQPPPLVARQDEVAAGLHRLIGKSAEALFLQSEPTLGPDEQEEHAIEAARRMLRNGIGAKDFRVASALLTLAGEDAANRATAMRRAVAETFQYALQAHRIPLIDKVVETVSGWDEIEDQVVFVYMAQGIKNTGVVPPSRPLAELMERHAAGVGADHSGRRMLHLLPVAIDLWNAVAAQQPTASSRVRGLLAVADELHVDVTGVRRAEVSIDGSGDSRSETSENGGRGLQGPSIRTT